MSEEDTRLGLKGYDPITVFEENSPVRGKFDLKLDHHGKIYMFRNVENRSRFKRNPGSFLPQFGGFCALACGVYGGLVSADADIRIIKGGRLYLFSSEAARTWWERFPFLIGLGEWHYERKFKLKVKG